MKPFSISFQRLLLLTTMLIAPTWAWAQDDAEEPADEGEIVVLGRFIPEPMRQTSEVATFLSNEDLARQGDDNAGAALTRLTGLSLVSGRFVFVRGLGDRYSSALLNGSPLPSPEPLRRTVPLDLFPSNILDGATVQKTYSPNYPGEFGGGIIDLRTVRMPAETFATFKVGTGANTATTGREGVFYYGQGDADWTGFDDGTRKLPLELRGLVGSGQRLSELDDETLERLGESFVNSPLTVLQKGDISPDAEVELSGGTSIDVGSFNIGLIGVAGYDSAWRTERAYRQLGVGNTLYENMWQISTTWDITSNALGGVSLGWGENEIGVTGLYVHSTSKEAQYAQGYDFNSIGVEQQAYKEGTGWYERELASLQLAGDHRFGALDLAWRVAGAQSTRDAPYERAYQLDLAPDGEFRYLRANSNSTRFSELTDKIVSGGLDGSYTLPLSETRDAVFSAGYAYSNTVREYSLLQFVFGGGTPLPEDVSNARVDFLFSPDNIDPARFVLLDLTGPDDSYKGGLLVNAGYVSADVELMPLLRAAVGVRYEDGRQTVRTFNRTGAPSTTPALIENAYWLPATTLTWNFADNLQLRLGYSQTIARPQFRELAVSEYIDPDTDRIYRGNPFLLDSELVNYDARLEYYFGANQFFTIGGFYKEIENPIEEVQFESSTANFRTAFINAPLATLYGGEAEYRTRIDIPDHQLFFPNGQFLFSANYTYTHSELQAEEGDQVFSPLRIGELVDAVDFGLDGSQLQGTPEHILNVQLGFEDETTQVTMLLGWVSERILQRGIGTSDIVEEPGVNLDLVYRRNFVVGEHEATLSLSARNILAERHREYLDTELGRLEANTYNRGTSLSASISAKF